MTSASPKTPLWLQIAPPLCVALLAGAWIVNAVRDTHSAPGMTLDEPFNANEGVRLVYGIRGWYDGLYSIREVFGDADEFPRGRKPPLGYHLADHPPLGRVWLGMWHELADSSDPDAGSVRVAAARVGSAVAFAMTVFLIGFATARWHGGFAGIAASLCLATMPRLFGHAHLASLETVTNLTFTAALLAVAAFWQERPPRLRVAVFTGLLFGVALLTKMQAVFLPLPVAVWALARYRQRAVLPLLVWGGVGLAVFFAGWPWLWLDPLHHPLEYFRQTTERVSLHTYYFGTRYLDRAVPWHYPCVMFLLTVPVGWLVAGSVGIGTSCLRHRGGSCQLPHESQKLAASATTWRTALLAGTMLLPLIVFAMPGVTVYDGVRLFLVVFPLWAIFAGRGAAAVLEWLRERSTRFAVPLMGVLLATSLIPLWQFRPAYLSFYNAAAGGLWGAQQMGQEVSYWGDGLTAEFLNEAARAVPEGATIDVVPVMHQFQLPALRKHSPVIDERGITLRGYDPPRTGPPRYVLFYRRRADLPPELEPLPGFGPARSPAPTDDARVLAVVRRQGVVIAALIELRPRDLLASRERQRPELSDSFER